MNEANWTENGRKVVLTAAGCDRLVKQGKAVKTDCQQVVDGVRYFVVQRDGYYQLVRQ